MKLLGQEYVGEHIVTLTFKVKGIPCSVNALEPIYLMN